MTTKEKRRCRTIACAVAHLQKGYTLYHGDATDINETEKIIKEMIAKDLNKGNLSGVLSDYKINIIEPKNKKSLFKINITR